MQMTLNFEELAVEAQKHWSGVSLAHIKVKNGNQWTDCWLSAYVRNGRVIFELNHEKGYPSEHKGTVTKSIIAYWLSKELPKL